MRPAAEGNHARLRRLLQGDVAGNDQHRHPTLADRGADGAVEQFGHLLGVLHHLTEMAAFAEQLGGMGFTEIARPISLDGICAAIASTGTWLR